MIQLLKKDQSVFASMVHDHKYNGLSTDEIIEMTDCDSNHLVDCISAIIGDGLIAAREKYHEAVPLKFDFYASTMSDVLIKKGLKKVFISLRHTFKRYGLNPNLLFSVFVKLPYYYMRKTLSKLLRSSQM